MGRGRNRVVFRSNMEVKGRFLFLRFSLLGDDI